MRELLAKAWLRPLIVGLNLWTGFFGGSWATMRWLSRGLQARIKTMAELDFEVAEIRRTLARMEMDTCRNALPKIEEEQVVVLSAGTLAKPRWTWRERPA